MKVCFIAPKSYQLFNPKVRSTFGGSEVQLFLIASQLAGDQSIDCHFMVADFGQKNRETFDNITTWKSINFKANMLKQIWVFYQTLKKIQADIYIQRALSKFSGIIAFICKLSGKKFAYMVANDGEVDLTHPIHRNPIWKTLAKKLFKFSNLIYVQSEYQKEAVKKNFNRDSIIIRSVVAESKRADKPDSKDYILWIGRCDKLYKQPEHFLHLARENPDYKFVMIAPAATNQQDYFELIRKQASTVSNLLFINFVPHNESNSYFQKAKLLVNTSNQEGFPATFLQAGINKTPILSLNVNPDNIFDKNKIGLVSRNDLSELDKNLQQIMTNAELYQQLSNNIYNYTIKNHSLRKNSSEFYEELTKLVSHG